MRRAGFLDAVGVRVLLDDAGAERLSGTLRISHDTGEMDIYFTHGEIYYAAVPDEPAVEELLAEAGVISREQRDTLGVNTARGRYLGRALVGDRPDVDHRAISVFVRSRTVDRVSQVLGLRNGKFLFLAHEHHPAGVIDAVPVGAVLDAAEAAEGRSRPGATGTLAGLGPGERADAGEGPRRPVERPHGPLRRFGSQPVPTLPGRGPAVETGPPRDERHPGPAAPPPATQPADRTDSATETRPSAPTTGPVDRAPGPSTPLPSRPRPQPAPPMPRAEPTDDAGTVRNARPDATDDRGGTGVAETAGPARAVSPARQEQPARDAATEDSRAAMARSSVRRRALERLIRSIRT